MDLTFGSVRKADHADPRLGSEILSTSILIPLVSCLTIYTRAENYVRPIHQTSLLTTTQTALTEHGIVSRDLDMAYSQPANETPDAVHPRTHAPCLDALAYPCPLVATFLIRTSTITTPCTYTQSYAWTQTTEEGPPQGAVGRRG